MISVTPHARNREDRAGDPLDGQDPNSDQGDKTAGGNPAPSNTSLGRIGLGYIYTDWIPQITYTTANYGGFTASIGAFTPLDDGAYTSHNSPQWQGGLAFVWGDPGTTYALA